MEITKEKYEVFDMTSRDFGDDRSAHLSAICINMDNGVTNMYRDGILYNKHLFHNRTVLNVRCGIGLLALFAAQAGAKCVYAVDASNAADYAHLVVEKNSLSETIKVLKGDIRKIELPVEKVDVIVCDWIGYTLFYESHISETIYARDKWLSKGGIIFPDVGKLYVAAVNATRNKNENIEWWRNVYGFKMNAIRKSVIHEPHIQRVYPKQIMSTTYQIYSIDLNKATLDDLKFRKPCAVHMVKNGIVDGLVTYFKVIFSKSHKPMCISTHPNAPCTRWWQTVFYFDKHIFVQKHLQYCVGMMLLPLNKEIGSNDLHVQVEFVRCIPPDMYNYEAQMCYHFKHQQENCECEEKYAGKDDLQSA